MKTFKELREDLNGSDELNEIVSKLFPWTTGQIDKGLHKILDKLEKMTSKHVGVVKKFGTVQRSSVPSAGKDRANDSLRGKQFKKEAEDFHRKAKKQWTWSKREVGDSFKYYGDKKIPTEQKEAVSDLQAEMQKIIDMHTQLEKMMQTTGNSVKYQRTMEKLERDTNRVFKDIAKVTERGDAKYRAMQGMDNLKKAKKMTHKTPGQQTPAKFRAYANMGEEQSFSEFASKFKIGDKSAIKKAKESNNKKLSPTKFLQPIIKRFPKHEDELRKHISTHVELDSPSGYAKLRKDINATLDKIAK